MDILKKMLFSDSNLRLGWILILLLAAIIAGEMLVVDPVGNLLENIGIQEMNSSTPQEWPHFFHECCKRGLRSILVFLSVWIVLRRFNDRDTADLAVRSGTTDVNDIVRGFGFGAFIQLFSVLVMSLWGWYRITGFLWEYNGYGYGIRAFLYAVIYSMETGIIEEALFRWFLISVLRSRFGLGISIIVSSCVFGSLHFSGFQSVFPWWASVVSSFAV